MAESILTVRTFQLHFGSKKSSKVAIPLIYRVTETVTARMGWGLELNICLAFYQINEGLITKCFNAEFTTILAMLRHTQLDQSQAQKLMMAQTSQHNTIRTTNSEKRVQVICQNLLLQQRNANGLFKCEFLKHCDKIYAHNIFDIEQKRNSNENLFLYWECIRLLKLSHNYKTPPTFFLPLIFPKISMLYDAGNVQ